MYKICRWQIDGMARGLVTHFHFGCLQNTKRTKKVRMFYTSMNDFVSAHLQQAQVQKPGKQNIDSLSGLQILQLIGGVEEREGVSPALAPRDIALSIYLQSWMTTSAPVQLSYALL